MAGSEIDSEADPENLDRRKREELRKFVEQGVMQFRRDLLVLMRHMGECDESWQRFRGFMAHAKEHEATKPALKPVSLKTGPAKLTEAVEEAIDAWSKGHGKK